MEKPDNGPGRGNRSLIRSHVGRKVLALQTPLLADASSAKATAARLRRAIGRDAGSSPEVWDATLGNIPQELVGRGDEPSYAEASVHTAITLYALHQQSKSEPMHVNGNGLGTAVFRLIGRDGNADLQDSPVIRRFNALSTADSLDEMSWHLRGIITQLRGFNIPLDYAVLAGQLYDFNFENSRDRVRLAWGRELYAAPKKKLEQEPAESDLLNQTDDS